jgi:hypothetical protein
MLGKNVIMTEFWLEVLKGRDHSGEIDVDGRIIFN